MSFALNTKAELKTSKGSVQVGSQERRLKKRQLRKTFIWRATQKAKDLATKELLGPEKYQREVVSTSAIGQGIKKMNETDKEVSFFACY